MTNIEDHHTKYVHKWKRTWKDRLRRIWEGITGNF